MEPSDPPKNPGPPARAPVPGAERPEPAPTEGAGSPDPPSGTAAQPARLGGVSEKGFLRLSVFQSVLALAGLFTGAVALYAALVESEAVRRQSAAIVWPHVQVRLQTAQGSETPLFAVELVNSGVGPARLYQARLHLGGEVVESWSAAVAKAGAPDAPFSFDSLTGRVLRPGETLSVFTTTDPEAAEALFAISEAGAAQLELCYCSIYEECWLRQGAEALEQPEPVRACPDFGAEAFAN